MLLVFAFKVVLLFFGSFQLFPNPKDGSLYALNQNKDQLEVSVLDGYMYNVCFVLKVKTISHRMKSTKVQTLGAVT